MMSGLWHREQEQRYEHMTRMRNKLQQYIQREISSVVVHGESVERLPHSSQETLPGLL